MANNGFNPLSALTTIVDKHDGKIDPATLQSYLSFVSFLSLFNIYQSFAPQMPAMDGGNADFSGMLNQFMNSNGTPNTDSMSSLLSSIPPDALAKASAMLGNMGGPAGLANALGGSGGLASALGGLGGGKRRKSSPLGGLMSMVASNPGMLSALGSGLLGGGGLGSLLGGLGGKAAAGAPLLSALGGEAKAGAASGALGGLGALGGNIAAFAPFLPYVSNFGKIMGKKVKQRKGRKRRSRRRSQQTEAQPDQMEQMSKLLEKSGMGKYSNMLPALAALAGTGKSETMIPMLLPMAMANSGNIKKCLKKGLRKPKRKSSSAAKQTKIPVTPANTPQVKPSNETSKTASTNIPINTTHNVKVESPPKTTIPISKETIKTENFVPVVKQQKTIIKE